MPADVFTPGEDAYQHPRAPDPVALLVVMDVGSEIRCVNLVVVGKKSWEVAF